MMNNIRTLPLYEGTLYFQMPTHGQAVTLTHHSVTRSITCHRDGKLTGLRSCLDITIFFYKNKNISLETHIKCIVVSK